MDFQVVNGFLLAVFELLLESLDLASELEDVFFLVSSVLDHDGVLVYLVLLLLIEIVVVPALIGCFVKHGLMLDPLLQLGPLLFKHEVVILQDLDKSLVVLYLLFVVQFDFFNLDLHSKVVRDISHLLEHPVLSHKVLDLVGQVIDLAELLETLLVLLLLLSADLLQVVHELGHLAVLPEELQLLPARVPLLQQVFVLLLSLALVLCQDQVLLLVHFLFVVHFGELLLVRFNRHVYFRLHDCVHSSDGVFSAI